MLGSTAFAADGPAAAAPGAPPPQPAAPKRAQRLEELFVWKLSDELKLSPTDEKKFSDLIHDLNNQKAQLHEKVEASLKKLEGAATEKARVAAFGEYRKNLQAYQNLSIEELDRVKALLGLERLAKYVEIKSDLTSKVKSLLLDRGEKKDEAPAKALPPPRIIEQ